MTSQPATDRALSTWGVLAICAVAQFMVVLDVTIVNVALPEMRELVGAGLATLIRATFQTAPATSSGGTVLGNPTQDIQPSPALLPANSP